MPAPIGFLLGFLLFIIVAAIVILGIRWLIEVTGVAVSPTLNLIISLILLLILLSVVFAYLPVGYLPWHR